MANVRTVFFLLAVAAVGCRERPRIVARPAPAVNAFIPGCGGQRFYHPGGRVKLAVPVTRTEPKFDAAAAASYRHVMITVEALVDRNGHVCDAYVTCWHAPVPVLDRACADAIRHWTFRPATRNGQPVNSTFDTTCTVQ
jgi:protein TonB